MKKTLESKDAHIAELRAELLSTEGSYPKPRPMKRFPYGNDIIISPIDRNSHGYQEGWPLSARTDFSEGVAARAIRTAALSVGRCGELQTEMRQVYEQMDVCQWDKEYQAAMHDASERRILERMHLLHNFPQTKQEQKDVDKDIKLSRIAARIVPPYFCGLVA